MQCLAQREGDGERIETELGKVAAGGGGAGGREGDRQRQTETERLKLYFSTVKILAKGRLTYVPLLQYNY